jgi:hypothetical protein
MSPTTRLARVSAPLAVVLALLPAAAAAAAAPPGKSITAVATARIEIDKAKVAKNSKAIGAAVEAARARAVSAAIVAAREEGVRLASAGGLALGELWSVEELAPSPFGPFYGGAYGADGTFGPGKYCGTIRTAIFHRTANGRSVFTHRFRSHFGCRVPSEVSQTVSATFAAS